MLSQWPSALTIALFLLLPTLKTMLLCGEIHTFFSPKGHVLFGTKNSGFFYAQNQDIFYAQNYALVSYENHALSCAKSDDKVR